MPTCPSCGSAGQDAAFCTECGAPMGTGPVSAPEADTIVVPPKAHGAGSPATAPTSGPGRSATRDDLLRRTLIATGIAAGLIVVAALGFGIPALMNAPSRNSVPRTGASIDALQVSNAPDLSKGGGSFLHGYRETWRFSESSDSSSHYYTLLADAGDVLVVNHQFVDPSGAYGMEGRVSLIGISKQTGKELWKGLDTTDVGVECAPKPFGQWIVCSIGQDASPSGLLTIDPKTGQKGPALAGLPSDPWTPLKNLTVADGALYVQTGGRDPEELTTRKYTDPATVAWKVTSQIDAADPGWSALQGAGRSEGPLVLLQRDRATFFDAASGTLVDSNPDAHQMALLTGPTILQLDPGGLAVERKQLAGGETYCSVRTESSPMQATSTMAPIAVNGPGVIVGFDSKSCKQTWQANLLFIPYRSAWNGGDIAVISGDTGEIVGVKVSDGSVVWQSTLPNHTDSFSSREDVPSDGLRGMVQLQDGTILVDFLVSIDQDGMETDNTLALDPATGSQVWQAPHGLFGGNRFITIAEPSLQDGFLIAQDQHAIIRLDPADEWSLDAQAASLPQGTPSCPDGMSPLTFSRYQEGAILVCGTKEGTFAVVARDASGKELRASKLSFAGRSCEVSLADGQTVRLSLGGAWVQTVNGSKSAQFAASEAWDYRAGDTTFSSAASVTGVTQCPAGSWPISMSTWDGGWLLVCGTSADKPTLLAYSDKEAGQGEATSVSAGQGGYCGQAKAGQACTYAAPATVRLPGGKGIQRNASANSFDNQGPGAQEGQAGAYGVQAPKDTAEDQVRYLVDILNSSAQTRANLRPVLDRVNEKNVGSAEIAALTTVSDSRRDLRAAVLAAPVDQVPDGQALVTELAHALQVSEDCDRLYVEWAKIVQAGQDDAAIVSQWQPKAEESDVAKQAFLDRWNSAIVPKFGVQSFAVDQI